MRRYKVLVSAPYMQSEIDKFRDFFERNEIDIDMPDIVERMNEGELLKIIGNYDGVVAGDDEFTSQVLDRAKRLRVISKWGTGIDSIDREHAEKLGIRVYNTLNAFSEPVSDSVIGYILCFARNIIESDRDIREGLWKKTKCYTLEEQTLGIIGLGNCGLAVARKASAFGMKILGNDIREISPSVLEQHRVSSVDKDTIYGSCDYITLHPDLNPTSYHMITERELKKMKPSVVLINTSRGPVIKEADLVRALEKGWIRGAALDVFEAEPLPSDSKFRTLGNCILSPHNSNSSFKCWDRVHENTLKNLLEGLKNERK